MSSVLSCTRISTRSVHMIFNPGQKLIPQARILPSATVPQTGRNPGMFVRKSAGADSSVLSHPMLWLDERIFGSLLFPRAPTE
jgi:hypothetical protein